ncbi:hypothetical protein [Shewanella algae]|uniref:hypothetical protein n=1 Tax=Shewanella algae TaxID=38313 RepID=UPI0031F5709E
MNPRILKKLTKKADMLIQALGVGGYGNRCVIGEREGYGFETSVKVERKHLERWGGKPNRYGYFVQLTETVGYGEMTGYYEREWSDLDAWSIIKSYVVDSFDDWKNAPDGEWPINTCPRRVKANPAGILRYARGMAKKGGEFSLDKLDKPLLQ